MWLGHGELSDGVIVYLAIEFRHRPLRREKGEEVCVEKGGGLCSNGDREMTLRIRRREAGIKRGIKKRKPRKREREKKNTRQGPTPPPGPRTLGESKSDRKNWTHDGQETKKVVRVKCADVEISQTRHPGIMTINLKIPVKSKSKTFE